MPACENRPWRDAVQFVVEGVAQVLGENNRQDVVLKPGRVLGTGNSVGGIPHPGFKGF